MYEGLENLIYIDKCALYNVKLEREFSDIDAVYALAKKHSLTAPTAIGLSNE